MRLNWHRIRLCPPTESALKNALVALTIVVSPLADRPIRTQLNPPPGAISATHLSEYSASKRYGRATEIKSTPVRNMATQCASDFLYDIA